MKPAVEKAIQKYLNSPDGDIKRIYPVIDKIDFNYRLAPLNIQDLYLKDYVTVDLYLNTPPTEDPPHIDDLWYLYRLDEHYLMDYHMPRIYKLFGLDNFSYMTNVYTPDTKGGYHNMREISNRGNIVTEK
tara:strand:+ start:586 stop:975 length:390 start_codon:yes stop_codon:yes gene_type:complete